MAIGELTPFYERQRQVAQSGQEMIKLQEMKRMQAEEEKARQLDMMALQQERQAPQAGPMPSMPPKAAPSAPAGDGVTTTPYDTTPPDITTTMKTDGGADVTIQQGVKPSQLPKEAQDKLASAKTEDEYNKILEAYKPTPKPGAVEGYKATTTEAAPTTTIADTVKTAGKDLNSAQTAVKSAYDRAELYRKNGLLSKYKEEIGFAQDLEDKQSLAQVRHINAQQKLLSAGSTIANGYLESVKADPSQNNSNRAWAMSIMQLQGLGFPATDLMKVTDVNQRQKIAQQYIDSSQTGLDKLDAQLKESQIKKNLATAKTGGKGSWQERATANTMTTAMLEVTGGKDETTGVYIPGAAENIMKLTNAGRISTSTGTYDNISDHGVLGATAKAIGTKLTDTDKQMYRSVMTDLVRQTATLTSGGRYKLNEAQVKQEMDALMTAPNQSHMTMLEKIAKIKQNAINGARASLESGSLNEDQANSMREGITKLNDIIPWNANDVIEFHREGGKAKDFQTWLEEKKGIKVPDMFPSKKDEDKPAAKMSSAGTTVFTKEVLDQLDSL